VSAFTFGGANSSAQRTLVVIDSGSLDEALRMTASHSATQFAKRSRIFMCFADAAT
jgi:hypothetical protein